MRQDKKLGKTCIPKPVSEMFRGVLTISADASGYAAAQPNDGMTQCLRVGGH